MPLERSTAQAQVSPRVERGGAVVAGLAGVHAP